MSHSASGPTPEQPPEDGGSSAERLSRILANPALLARLAREAEGEDPIDWGGLTLDRGAAYELDGLPDRRDVPELRRSGTRQGPAARPRARDDRQTREGIIRSESAAAVAQLRTSIYLARTGVSWFPDPVGDGRSG